MKIVRVLHVFGTLNAGGAESRTIDIYKAIDRNRIQFDFLIHSDDFGFFGPTVSELGGRLFRIPRLSFKTMFCYSNEVDDFFSSHREYRIVHGHILSTAFVYLKAAHKHGVPFRIAHSRCGTRTNFSFSNSVKEITKRRAKKYATHLLAVSQPAAESAFGTEALRNGTVRIFPNAIESEKFSFDSATREEVRCELGLSDRIVIGHIGRFTRQKNHRFIIETFARIRRMECDARLILVGDGELRGVCNKMVRKLGLEESVFFLGIRQDVPRLLSAMDVFFLPSFYEGLPGVVLEAQASGLPCVISDRVTREVKVTDLVRFISLKSSAEFWAKEVLKASSLNNERKDAHLLLNEAGFDVSEVAKDYEDFYLGTLNTLEAKK